MWVGRSVRRLTGTKEIASTTDGTRPVIKRRAYKTASGCCTTQSCYSNTSCIDLSYVNVALLRAGDAIRGYVTCAFVKSD